MYEAVLGSSALLEQIQRVIVRSAAALGNGNQLLFFGNGGSAADAQHLAAELVGRFYMERRALPAQALTTNPSIVTAIGNDYEYSEVFARQVQAMGRVGDVAFGISTSGRSENVVRGLKTAQEIGMYTVALTGHDGGALPGMVHECLCVPAEQTPRIQEAHILIGHLICEGIERALFES